MPRDGATYGRAGAEVPAYGRRLARIDGRGEKKLLRVSAEDYMGLRHNPFFAYLESRLRDMARGEPAPLTAPP